MHRSLVRWVGVPVTALLAAGAFLACGAGDDDGDLEREVAVDTVAGARYGAVGSDEPARHDGPWVEADDPVTDSPRDATETPVTDTPPQPPASDPAGGGSRPSAPSPATPAPGTTPGATPGATPPGAPAVSTDAILRATSRRYEQVRSIQAEFEQEMRNPLLGQTIRSRGTLYQRQPDRFLMRFSDPAGDIIVSDGQFFWLYYPSVDARQVIRAPRGPQGLDLHSQFIGDPVARFEATSHGRESVRGREAHVLDLVPREALGYRTLKVWIDVEDNLVRRFELTEENGNVRRFELSNVVVNPSLSDGLFEFTPPPGAQVIQRG